MGGGALAPSTILQSSAISILLHEQHMRLRAYLLQGRRLTGGGLPHATAEHYAVLSRRVAREQAGGGSCGGPVMPGGGGAVPRRRDPCPVKKMREVSVAASANTAKIRPHHAPGAAPR